MGYWAHETAVVDDGAVIGEAAITVARAGL